MTEQTIAGANAQFGARFNPLARRPYFDPVRNESRVLVGNNGQSIRTNAPASLQYDEWKDIDRTVLKVATDRLTGVKDLIERGQVHNLGSVGKTISLWDKESDMTEASIDMDGITAGEEDKPQYETAQVPVPVVSKTFRINWRHLEGSRTTGEPIDVSASAIAGRVVAEKSEDMLFGGSTIKVEGGTIAGYTTHVDRNTVDLANVWTSATGAQILADAQAMLAGLRADNYYGPYCLYIPGEYEGVLDNEFDPSSADTRTMRDRLLQLSNLNEIKVADRLTANNVVMVQMTNDVADMAIAQDITTIEWSPNGGLTNIFKVMAIWVPRIKSDFDGRSGVSHLRAA